MGVLVVILAVGASIYTTATRPPSISENRSSPAYKIVRELKRAKAIDSFRAVAPDTGYSVKYELDDGNGYVEFDKDSVEFEGYDDVQNDAIETVLAKAGYSTPAGESTHIRLRGF